MALRDGRVLTAEATDFPGFVTRERTWEATQAKFDQLAAPFTTPALRARLLTMVTGLDEVPVTALTHLLRSVALPRNLGATRGGTDSRAHHGG